jgi:hypothetical protein
MFFYASLRKREHRKNHGDAGNVPTSAVSKMALIRCKALKKILEQPAMSGPGTVLVTLGYGGLQYMLVT